MSQSEPNTTASQGTAGKSNNSEGSPLAPHQSESSLIIARSTRPDSGHYTCRASNKHGQDKMVINLLVQDVPDKVAGLKVTNVTAQTISLRWQLGFTGNSPVSSYLVQYQSDDPLDDLLMSVARGNGAQAAATATSPSSSIGGLTRGDSATGHTSEMATTTEGAAPHTAGLGGGDFSPMRLYNHLFGSARDETAADQGDEFLMMGLRLAEGIDPARYAALKGRALDAARIDGLVADGLLARRADGRIAATPRGAPVLNSVVAALAA